jgi:hydroxyacylglutathione hydrolase
LLTHLTSPVTCGTCWPRRICAATQFQGSLPSFSTIGRERRVNPALTLDEQRYVSELLAGLDAYPAYYAHMGPANAAGPMFHRAD